MRKALLAGVVGSSLLLTVPLAMGFVLMAKTARAPTGWFFDALPGVGLGLVGILGSGLMAQFVVTATTAPPWSRVLVAGAWTVQFGAILGSMPIYLMAASEGHTIAEQLERIDTLHYLVYMTVPLMCESAVPALMIILGYEAQVDHRLDVAVEAAKVGAKGNADKILEELRRRRGPATLQELATVCGCTLQTVKNNVAKLDAVALTGSRCELVAD